MSVAYFSQYTKKIKDLGVVRFEAHVFEGHVVYQRVGNFIAQVFAIYNPLEIAQTHNINEFKAVLLAYQQG